MEATEELKIQMNAEGKKGTKKKKRKAGRRE
jgi:hypothetical protein